MSSVDLVEATTHPQDLLGMDGNVRDLALQQISGLLSQVVTIMSFFLPHANAGTIDLTYPDVKS